MNSGSVSTNLIYQMWNFSSWKSSRTQIRIQRNLNQLNRSSDEEVIPEIRSSVSSFKNPKNSMEVPVRPNCVDRSPMIRGTKKWSGTGPSKSGGPVPKQSERWFKGRGPVCPNHVDRSSQSSRQVCEACTGPSKSGGPVYTLEFAVFGPFRF